MKMCILIPKPAIQYLPQSFCSAVATAVKAAAGIVRTILSKVQVQVQVQIYDRLTCKSKNFEILKFYNLCLVGRQVVIL